MKRFLRPPAIYIFLLILFLTAFLFGFYGGFKYPKRSNVVAQSSQKSSPDVYNLWTLVNEQRTKVGLSPLALDERLDKSAQKKCDDMAAKGYWDHNAPDGSQPWHFFYENFGKFSEAGENLAYGFADSQSVVYKWMSSPEHRENILKPSFSEVGYAVCTAADYQGEDHTTVVVQHLVTP